MSVSVLEARSGGRGADGASNRASSILELSGRSPGLAGGGGLVDRLWYVLSELAARSMGRWFGLDSQYSWVGIQKPAGLQRVLEQSLLEGDSGSGGACYCARLDLRVGGVRDARAVATVVCVVEHSATDYRWRIEIDVADFTSLREMPGEKASARRKRSEQLTASIGIGSEAVRDLFARVAAVSAARWGWVNNRRLTRAGMMDSAPRAGWLTYLSRSLGSLPEIPRPTEVVPVRDVGWILVAQPEPVDESNAEHQASLAYVRHALGARVLMDGPSFPPPAQPEPAVAAVAEPDPAPAPEVPSYLKTPPRSEPPAIAPVAPPAPLAPAAPAVVSIPFAGETSEINLAQLLKSSVPFDANAAPSPAVAEPSKSTAPAAFAPTGTTAIDVSEIPKPTVPFEGKPVSTEKKEPVASVPGFTETVGIDISELFKSAVPFAPGAGTPKATEGTPGTDTQAPMATRDDQHAAKAPSPGFGETGELNLGDLLKRDAPMPFAKAAEQPKTEALPAVTVSPPRTAAAAPVGAAPPSTAPSGKGRWIRFNPQTGEPLATPYWQELPAEPDKKKEQ